MMRAYLVDDERLATERLKRLLEATGRVTIAGTATDPEEALEFLRSNPVDVLFLDIQMPGLTGFELLERLDTDVAVVFTTAYDRYAIEAFGVNSIDYLLKPVEPERLDKRARQARAIRGPAAARRPRAGARARRASWRRTGGWNASPRASASGRRCSTSRASTTSPRRTS